MKKRILIALIITVMLTLAIMIVINSGKSKEDIEIIKKTENNKFYFEKRVKGVKKFSVKGDNFSIGNDKKIHIKGNVLTEMLTGKKIVKIFSDEMEASPDFKKIVFLKNIKVKSNKIILKGEEIIYNVKVIRSKLPVLLKGENFSFRAKDFFYELDKDLVVFRNIKDFKIIKNNSVFKIEPKNMFLYNKQKILKIAGTPLKITNEKENKVLIIEMSHLYLNLTENNKLYDGFSKNINITEISKKFDEKEKEIVKARKIVMSHLRLFFENNDITEIFSNSPGRITIIEPKIRRNIIFSSIKAKFSDNNLREIELLNSALKTIKEGSNKKGKGGSEYLQIIFDNESKVSEIKAKDSNFLFLIDEKASLTAQEAYISLTKKRYKLFKKSTFNNNKDFYLKGKSIIINSKKNIEAIGNVSGFLDKGKFNFICDSFVKKGDATTFIGNVYIKSSDGEIFGEKVKIEKNKDSKIINGKLLQKDIEIKGGIIEISEETIDVKNKILFMKGDNLKIRGENATISIKNKKYEKALIKGNIKINFNEGQGRCETAEIDLKKKIVYLTGKARFEDQKGTKIEGEKLTLNLENGKIYATSKVDKKVKVIIKEE